MTASDALVNLQAAETTTQRLIKAGLHADTAAAKAAMFETVAKVMAEHGIAADAGVRAFFVPGRVEVVGKHVDYGGGRSLVAAVDRGFCMIVQPRQDATVRLIRADGQGIAEFQISPELQPKAGHWSNYPMTVARRLARNFPGVTRGADIAFLSDLPPASGLSSSSAIITAIFMALASVNDLQSQPLYQEQFPTLESLSGYLGAIENGSGYGNLPGDRGVGTFGGSQDHAAIVASQPDVLTQFAYCPVRLERRVPMPAGYTFVIGFSGANAEKTGNAQEQYNQASKLASTVIDIWRRETGRDDQYMADALASSPDAADRIRTILKNHPVEVQERFEHFYAESIEIVPQCGDALVNGDVEAFGRVVDRSQQLTETQLKNQVPQTVALAKLARQCGAAAASAFGAGFGGSVWALVRQDEVERFITAWSNAYEKVFPDDASRAVYFPTQAGPPAFELL